jgi:hypothetical protein
MTRTRIGAAVAAIALICASIFGGAIAANAAPPAPSITAPPPSMDGRPLISGAQNNDSATDLVVTVTVDGDFYCDATMAYFDTTWSCQNDPLAEPLLPGRYDVVATTAELATPADASGPSNTVELIVGGTGPPAFFNPEPDATVNDSTPLFEGTGPAFGTVNVYLNGEAEMCADVPVDDTGYWTCSSSLTLTEGTYFIAVTGRWADGTLAAEFDDQNLTYVDPPATPVITGPVTPTTSYAQSLTFEGTIANPDGATYLIYVIPNTDGGSACQDEVLPGETTWSCAGMLTSGTMDYYAVAYEGDSNGSLASNSVFVTYTPLEAPVMNYVLGESSIGISATGVPGSEIEVEFYSTRPGGEGGYEFDLIANCPAGEDGGGEGEGGFASFGPTPVGCTFDGLAPGVYNAFTQQSIDGLYSPYADDYFLIPSTPTFAAGVNEDRTVRFAGVGTPGYRVLVQNLAGTTVCEAIVGPGGTWSCSAAPATGTQAFRAVQQSQGFVAEMAGRSFQGFSSYTASVNVTVPAPPVPAVPAAPAPAPTPTPTPTPTPPAPFVWTFSAGGGEYEPGDETDLVGKNLPAGSLVDAEFHSTPVKLGSTSVGPDGTFTLHVTIPVDATAGLHHFVVTVTPPGGEPSVVEQPVTITIKPKGAASGPPKTGVAIADTGAPGAVGDDRNNPAAPSSMTHSLDPVQAILANPIVIGGAALAGLVLFLLVAFPAELLNSTISENYGRFAKRIPPVKVPWWTRFTTWLQQTPLAGGLAITVVAAIIFGFADPGFGFDITSLRVVLACAIALFIVGYLASTISGAIIRRRWGLATEMELKPLGLILTVIGVVLSRVLEFSPGFLLGLILGIALVGRTTVAQRAKATLVQAGVVFVLAILGWVGYSILTATTNPDTFLTALAFDTMVAITAEGLTALFIGMLPFKLLDGESVFQFNKLLWVAVYIVAAFAFILIVVPSSWGELSGSLSTWLIVLAGFAIVAVGIYVYFRFFAKPEPEESEVEQEKVDA